MPQTPKVETEPLAEAATIAPPENGAETSVDEGQRSPLEQIGDALAVTRYALDISGNAKKEWQLTKDASSFTYQLAKEKGRDSYERTKAVAGTIGMCSLKLAGLTVEYGSKAAKRAKEGFIEGAKTFHNKFGEARVKFAESRAKAAEKARDYQSERTEKKAEYEAHHQQTIEILADRYLANRERLAQVKKVKAEQRHQRVESIKRSISRENLGRVALSSIFFIGTPISEISAYHKRKKAKVAEISS